jgi:hypothetical protein
MTAVEAVEGEGQSAVDRCFGLVVAHTRRLIHHKSFFGDFCANDRSDIYLEFLPRPLLAWNATVSAWPRS